ncbi:MAG: hypothetical protein HY719_17190 [Planctomycetes bacterium]|nr:hypothetical protein [Planctomycetota bacterium]
MSSASFPAFRGDDGARRFMEAFDGALSLAVAAVGLELDLFNRIGGRDLTAGEIAAETGLDAGMVERWSRAAWRHGFLDRVDERYALAPGALRLLSREGERSLAGVVRAGAAVAAGVAGLCDALRGGSGGQARAAAAAGWAAAREQWDEDFSGPLWRAEVLPRVKEIDVLLAPGGRFCDAAPGSGWLGVELARRHPRCTGVLLAGDETAAARLQQRLADGGVAGRVRAASSADPARGEFGGRHHLVILRDALPRLLAAGAGACDPLFRGARQALCEGGALLVADVNRPAQPLPEESPRDRLFDALDLMESLEGRRLSSAEEAAALLEAAGYAPTEVLFQGGRYFALVARG